MVRVAEILDIDQQELEDAFKQAMGEKCQEALDTRFQKMVEEGEMTQAQADEYKDWLQSRPDVPMPRSQRTNAFKMHSGQFLGGHQAAP